jgi:hypothetical protein
MKFALTKYGWPQLVVFPVIVLAAMILVARLSSLVPRLSIWVIISIEAGFAVVRIWILSRPLQNLSR